MQFFSEGGTGDYIFVKPTPSSFGNTINLYIRSPTSNINDYLVQETRTSTLSNKTITDTTNDVAASRLQTTTLPVNIKTSAPTGANKVLVTSNSTSAIWNSIPNAALSNAYVGIIAGTSLTGGGNVSLGSSITISHSNSAVTPGIYGSITKVPTFTVDVHGHITQAANVTIAPITINTGTGLNGGGTVYPSGSLTLSMISPVAANIGGTGQTSYTVGDILYASSTSALSKLSDITTGNALISGGVGVAPSWGKIGLVTHTSGILPSTKGGTGVNNAYNITLGGTMTTGGSFSTTGTFNTGGSFNTADAFTTTGPNSLTLNTTGLTSVTLPTTGTLVNTAVTTLAQLSSVGTLTSATWNANVIGATYGGTGLNSYATGDLLYASSSTTLGKLSDVAVGNVLLSGGIGVAPNWGKINFANHTTGILAPSQGGTGVSNSNLNTITLSGNLITSGGSSLTLTTLGPTNVTFPVSGTLVNTAVNTLSSLSSIGTITTGTWSATPIAATRGGTGLTTYTTGDLLYATSATTIGKLNDVGVGNVLISGGVGVAPSWGKLSIGNAVSGILPVANGGTGTSFLTAGNFIVGNGTSSVITTKVAPSGTVVGTTDSQILTNKTFTDSTTFFQDDVDNSKKMQFQLSGITTGVTRTLTVPDNNTTIVGTDATQTLTNKTFTDSSTLFQDDVDNSKKLQFQLSAITTGNTRILTVPDTNTTIVGTDAIQSLTNKTINTNTSNVIARALWINSGAGSVTTYAATAPSTGQVLTATSSGAATWQSIPSGVFGSAFAQSYSATEVSTTSAAFTTALTYTTASLTAGTYRINWYYEFRGSSTTVSVGAQVQIDNTTTIHNLLTEPKATGGTQSLSQSGFYTGSLTAGTHTIDIDFRTANATATAYMKEMRIEIWRIS